MGDVGDSSASAVRRRLTRAGLSEIETVLAGRIDWTAAQDFDRADPPPALVRHAEAALAEAGLDLDGAPVLVRHSPGQGGLPALGTGGTHRFAIDLTDGRDATQGGALLFFDAAGKGHGWKAEPGALTLWQGEDPVLSEVGPQGPVRVTLIGAAR